MKSAYTIARIRSIWASALLVLMLLSDSGLASECVKIDRSISKRTGTSINPPMDTIHIAITATRTCAKKLAVQVVITCVGASKPRSWLAFLDETHQSQSTTQYFNVPSGNTTCNITSSIGFGSEKNSTDMTVDQNTRSNPALSDSDLGAPTLSETPEPFKYSDLSPNSCWKEANDYIDRIDEFCKLDAEFFSNQWERLLKYKQVKRNQKLSADFIWAKFEYSKSCRAQFAHVRAKCGPGDEKEYYDKARNARLETAESRKRMAKAIANMQAAKDSVPFEGTRRSENPPMEPPPRSVHYKKCIPEERYAAQVSGCDGGAMCQQGDDFPFVCVQQKDIKKGCPGFNRNGYDSCW